VSRGKQVAYKDGLRRCAKCKVFKSTNAFYKNKEATDGLYSYCKECSKQRVLSYRRTEAGKQVAKRAEIKHTYGVSDQQFKALLKKQCGLCAICGKPFGDSSPCVDHCHRTQKVRGLLCSSCNKGLGFFLDNPTILSLAIIYLLNE
jgi:hypothetical protein